MVESYSKPLLVITGVTGFLGSHILKECIKENKWRIRSTVRDLKNKDKIEVLRLAVGD
jgi:uncharacterized protein YbjT (DUF2867 family)